jgi:hypothetical protein
MDRMDANPKESAFPEISDHSPRNRATLGFLFASLHTGASLVIWPSLLDAARRHDVNLICFPGGRLQAADSFEIQRNAIFDNVSTGW